MTERVSNEMVDALLRGVVGGFGYEGLARDLLDARRERDANMDAFVERCNAWHKLYFEYKLLTDKLSAANRALVWLFDHPMARGQKYAEVGIVVANARSAEGGEG